MEQEAKTEIELQAENEIERGWIRNLNSKLYDGYIKVSYYSQERIHRKNSYFISILKFFLLKLKSI